MIRPLASEGRGCREVLAAAFVLLWLGIVPNVVHAHSAGEPAAAGSQEKKPAKLDINAVPENARKVEFSTSEGTWLSIDVSPDGAWVLFDLLGDLYRVPMTGGKAERITSGPAYDYAPRYSPDGKTVVFCSDRRGNMNLFLMNADGTNPRPLTEEKDAVYSSPSWTPDGEYVLARREETNHAGIPPVELVMVHRDGGSGIKVINKDKLNNVGGTVASPDGRYLYLTGRERRFSYLPRMDDGLWNLYRFDRMTSEMIRLTPGPNGGMKPVLTPDGKRIAYVRRDDAKSTLVLRDLESGTERILTDALTRDEQEGFAQMDVYPNAAFTRDGKTLVFYSGGKIRKLDMATLKLGEVPFTADVSLDLRPLHRITKPVGEPELTVKLLRWPTLSPDGKKLVFDALGKLWVVDITNGKAGKPRRLTKDTRREYAPEFSPDGRSIAYVTWSDQELGHVWKMRSDGGTPTRLTKVAGHYVNPAWSPQGDRIAFVAGSGAEARGQQPENDTFYEIRWIPSSGGEAKAVTAVSPGDTLRFHPTAAWSPDGSRIFFAEYIPSDKPYVDGKTDLVSVRLDGTDKRRHLRFKQGEAPVPSPDGAWVAFVRADDVYVTPLPRAGTDPVEIGFSGDPVPVYRMSTEGGGYVGWADHGRMVVWGMADTFYRQPIARVREAVLKQAEEKRRQEMEGKKEEAGAESKELKMPDPEAIPVTLTVKKPLPTGSVVLKNARVLTMKGDEILERAEIVVTGNRIAAIGKPGEVSVPSGSQSFDLGGKTVIPGLVDVHAHPHYSAMEIFPEKKWEYVANLAYGVTTLHDPSAHSLDVFAEAEMVEAGEMIGPRIYSSGDVLYGGAQAAQYAKADTQEEVQQAVKRMKKYGAHWLKVYQQPRREQRIWFVEAARQEGVGVTMEGAGELHTDLTNFMDGFTGMEHSLPVPLYEDVVKLAAKSGTAYTPTLIVSYGGPTAELYWYQHANPHDDERLRRFVPHDMLDVLGRRRPWYPEEDFQFPTVANGAARIAREGGRVCLGAHGQLQGLGAHWELWSFTMGGGMTPMEALHAATVSGAEALGFAKDLGTVEVGKLADLVVIDGDPLADLHSSAKVVFTMKDGRLYDAATMNQVWPEHKPLGKFFWTR
jgi:Tol biopolymer transport system component/imidazolonepropionase-like amidohydrolase